MEEFAFRSPDDNPLIGFVLVNPSLDCLATNCCMSAGYHAIRALQDKEMELLLYLIRTRLITSILIGTYRSTLFPENSEYLLISQNSSKNFLLSLNRQNADLALERIRSVCASG